MKEKTVQIVIGILTAISMVVGGIWAMDSRYDDRYEQHDHAKYEHAGMQEQINLLQKFNARARMNEINNQLLNWEDISKRRPLTVRERGQVLELDNEKKMIECDLKLRKCE